VKKLLVAFGALTLLSASAHAAPDPAAIGMPSDFRALKPGLWQVTRRSEVTAPPITAASMDLSGLDPAARARVQAVLKRQATERAARGGGPEVNARTKQECLTAEALAKRQSPFERRGGRDDDCPPVVKLRTASRLVVTSQCSVEGHAFNVEMTFEVKSATETAMTMTSTGADRGQASETNETVSARWVGPACGGVKPATP
jgi:hypothetical protein